MKKSEMTVTNLDGHHYMPIFVSLNIFFTLLINLKSDNGK